jgi:hypothetical protein
MSDISNHQPLFGLEELMIFKISRDKGITILSNGFFK